MLRNVVCRDMRHNEIATGRHGSLQLVYDPIGIVIISDEMQDGDEQDSNRLIQIDEGLQGRMPDDLTGIAQITVNCNGQGILDEKGLRVRYHDRIIINVQDARVRLKANAMDLSLISVGGQLSGRASWSGLVVAERYGYWRGPGVAPGRAAGSTSGCFGQGIREGGGQAAAGAQTLTWAAAVRVATPRPAAGNAGRVLVLRSRCLFRLVTMRRLPRSCRALRCRAAMMAAGRLAVAVPDRVLSRRRGGRR